jgi:lipopolysaccharide transport protein LptA
MSVPTRPAAKICSRLVCALYAASSLAAAANLDLRDQDIDVSYKDSSSDLRNDVHEFTQVRITQSDKKAAQSQSFTIEADKATGKGLQLDRSQWTFTDSVDILTPEAELEADLASATIGNGRIASARVTGSPAQFQQRGAVSGRQIRGTAKVIDYDFEKGVVKLSGQVWFSDGENEYDVDTVTYDARKGQLNTTGPAHQKLRPSSLRRSKDAQNKDSAPPPTPRPGNESGA